MISYYRNVVEPLLVGFTGSCIQTYNSYASAERAYQYALSHGYVRDATMPFPERTSTGLDYHLPDNEAAGKTPLSANLQRSANVRAWHIVIKGRRPGVYGSW